MTPETRERFFGETLNVTILGFSVLALTIAFSILSPAFLIQDNVMSILRQTATVGMFACGQTIVILMADIDLSQASLASLVSITSTMIMTSFGVLPGIGAGLLTGLLFGLIMGLIITKSKVQSFVVTLGMQFTCTGLAYIISDGQVVYNLPEQFLFLGTGMIGIIPFCVILAAVTWVVLHILLSRTTHGRSIYALGGNNRAARLSGIAVDKSRITAWMINGILVALGGLILTARINSGQPELASSDYLMQSIGASVIGGSNLMGGKGGVIGTIFGVLFICILGNGLAVMGINQFIRQIVLGLIIIIPIIKIKK